MMAGFVPQLVRQDGDQLLYLITGRQSGAPVWCYALVPQRSQLRFMEALKQDRLKPGTYGQVLFSGQGDTPPDPLRVMMETHYGA